MNFTCSSYSGTKAEEQVLQPLPQEIREYIIKLIKSWEKRRVLKIIKGLRVNKLSYCSSISIALIYCDPKFDYKRPPHCENSYPLVFLNHWFAKNKYCGEQFNRGHQLPWYAEELRGNNMSPNTNY